MQGYYGAAAMARLKGSRQRLDIFSMLQGLFLPWLFFCGLFALLSCSLHFYRPFLTYTLVALAGLVWCALAWTSLRLKGEPSWYSFLSVTMAVAWLLAVVFGNMNYAATSQPYHSYEHMDVLPDVSPTESTGAEVLAAGRVDFGKHSVLDIRRSMSFKNVETYCVAPITVTKGGVALPLESYDFWAVGLNCCSLNTADFHCGEYNNPGAHSGLRLLDDEQRPFYRLAVEQAEAAYSLKAKHPVFFYWVQDSSEAMDAFRTDGYKYFLIGMLGHFAWQSFCVLLAFAVFTSWGFDR